MRPDIVLEKSQIKFKSWKLLKKMRTMILKIYIKDKFQKVELQFYLQKEQEEFLRTKITSFQIAV